MKFEFDKTNEKELRKQTSNYVNKNLSVLDIFAITEYLIEFQVNRLKDDPNFKEFLKELINQEKEWNYEV